MGNRTSRLDAQPLTSFTLPNVASIRTEKEKKRPDSVVSRWSGAVGGGVVRCTTPTHQIRWPRVRWIYLSLATVPNGERCTENERENSLRAFTLRYLGLLKKLHDAPVQSLNIVNSKQFPQYFLFFPDWFEKCPTRNEMFPILLSNHESGQKRNLWGKMPSLILVQSCAITRLGQRPWNRARDSLFIFVFFRLLYTTLGSSWCGLLSLLLLLYNGKGCAGTTGQRE